MICEKCGEDVQGILAWANHPCVGNVIEYKPMPDNEIRNWFMEIGMPNMGFEALGYAKPTEMERKIFEDNG